MGHGAIVLILAGTSLLGALITWWFRVETTGISLEQVDRMHDPSPPAGSLSPPLTSNRS